MYSLNKTQLFIRDKVIFLKFEKESTKIACKKSCFRARNTITFENVNRKNALFLFILFLYLPFSKCFYTNQIISSRIIKQNEFESFGIRRRKNALRASNTSIGFSFKPTAINNELDVSVNQEIYESKTNTTKLSSKDNDFLYDSRNMLKQYDDLKRYNILIKESRDDPPFEFTTKAATNNIDYNQINLYEKVDETSSKPNSSNDVLFARILVLVSAMLYGTNFTFVKLLGEHVPIGASASIRFVFAALATSPWLFSLLKNKEAEMNSNFEVIRTGMEVGMWNSIGYLAQAEGLKSMDASKSAFICSLAVVVVPILDVISGKSISMKKCVGAVMAVFGVGLLELGGFNSDVTLSHGDLLSFVQPITFGIGFWRMEHAMNRFPSCAKALTFSQLFAVALVSLFYCISGLNGEAPPQFHEVISWVTDPSTLGSLIWTGLITTALTIYMETLALKTLSASETTLLFSTEPLWGAVFAMYMVGERLGMSSAIGAAFIVLGCTYSNIEFSNKNKRKDKNFSNNEQVQHD